MMQAMAGDLDQLVNTVIDDKYLVRGICSNAGGMGTLLFVEPLKFRSKSTIVLKFCKSSIEEQVLRFKREVRLLTGFSGSNRVIQVLDHNLECAPPYFVMPFCEGGDLTAVGNKLREDAVFQERIFLAMVDCISELHDRGVFHRDIKPQNFLITEGRVVVSDFGLCSEIGSGTAFTRSSVWWGTQGYLPPEFLEDGGFKNPSVTADIFMLGKTFYALLSGRDPSYLVKSAVATPLFYVIEDCCALDVSKRISSLSTLKQRLVGAYDVLLGRLDSYGAAQQAIARVREDAARTLKVDIHELRSFVERLKGCDESEREIVCRDLTLTDFQMLAFRELEDLHDVLLDAYEEMVERKNFGWAFAEVVAANMKVMFLASGVDARGRVRSLAIAIKAAQSQYRFAAMDVCRDLISSPLEEDVAFLVAELVKKSADTFVGEMSPSVVKDFLVRKALKEVQEERASLAPESPIF